MGVVTGLWAVRPLGGSWMRGKGNRFFSSPKRPELIWGGGPINLKLNL